VQGYGDGKGNPASEEPQKQGKNPKADLEHPGPPPPKVAQGKSSSSPDEPESGAQSSQSQSQPSSSNKSEGSGSSKKGAPQPKILNESLPEPDEGVRKHNKEMEHRAERADSQASNKPEKDDAVSKSFWAGKSISPCWLEGTCANI
jgi:hypothetical protein